MTTRIGLMGLGRIGRNLFRLLYRDHDLELVAISDVAELEALGLQVNEARVPVQDPRQANRVVLQNPPPGSTVGPGSTVTIVVGVGFRND